MPLADYVEDRLARLRALLSAPDVVAIEVCTRPETELAAAKLVAAAATEDDLEPDLLIGYSGTFTDADALCLDLQATVAAEIDIAREALGDEQLAFRVPERISEDRCIAVEIRLVEYLERVAAALHDHVRQLVVALDVETEAAESTEATAGWPQTLARLLANTGSGRLKWVTFARKGKTRPVASHRHRTALRRPDEELAHLMGTPGGRMLTFIGRDNSPGGVARRLRRRLAGYRPWVVVEVPPQRFDLPLVFFTEAARALARQFAAAPHMAPLIEEAEELAAYPDPQLAFADLCHRITLAALRPGVGMVVVLHPPPAADPETYQVALDRLARAAASTRVKFITFEPLTYLPRTVDVQRLEPFEFDLGPQRMKAGIDTELAKPDLPPRQRLQMTMALAGYHLGHEEPELALELNRRALQMAEASSESVDACVACYQLGNTLYHICAFEEAEEAYLQAVHRALEADHLGVAAMALTGAGHSRFCREDAAAAVSAYAAARALFAKLGLVQHEIYVLTWMGQAGVMAEDYADAQACFKEALVRCDDLDPLHASTVESSKAEIFHRMAYLYALAGRPDLERRYQSQAQALGMAAAPCHHP